MYNSFGKLFRISTFGESHGPALGLVIDGCPAGIDFDLDFIQQELARRRPGQSPIVTQRKEGDKIELLSGVFEGKTTGTPIGLLIRNSDARSRDYDHIKDKFRPSHADYTYWAKYDGYRDYRGGGRASARETAARVAGGAMAKLLLRSMGVEIQAYVNSVGPLRLEKSYTELDLSQVESTEVRCPDLDLAEEMIAHIREVRKVGDTTGGTVVCVAKGCPPGWGEPLFGKLPALLAHAMLSIPACKGFEYGSGFAGTQMRGSEHNDLFYKEGKEVRTRSNHSGGLQGGITNGMDIYFKLAFKPVATIVHEQESINEEGEAVTVRGKGRHDPCVVPRAVPIVEAMTALCLADAYLLQRARQGFPDKGTSH